MFFFGAENIVLDKKSSPAIHFIFCAEPQHKRMPFLSGLKHWLSFLQQATGIFVLLQILLLLHSKFKSCQKENIKYQLFS
ncbi:hypothetical protein B4N84_06865 [Flavobacterium sp. IR1]|nr:hypothetical protein B4N84_06865 [Flavobacterium sp. IR1]